MTLLPRLFTILDYFHKSSKFYSDKKGPAKSTRRHTIALTEGASSSLPAEPSSALPLELSSRASTPSAPKKRELSSRENTPSAPKKRPKGEYTYIKGTVA